MRCRRAGQPPPLDLPLRPVPLRRRAAADRRRQRGAVADARDASSASPADEPGFASNAERVRNRDAVVAAIDAAFADATAGRAAAPSWLAAGVPAGRGAHPRPGLRLGPDPIAGPARRRRARHRSGRSRCRDRRCASTRRARPASAPTPGPADTRPARRVGASPGSTRGRRPAATRREHRPARVGALALIDTVLDPGSWRSWDAPPVELASRARLRAPSCGRRATGPASDESVVTGRGPHPRAPGRGRGLRVRLPRRLDRGARPRAAGRARSSGPPPSDCRCSPSPTSGGTRMQEGTRRVPPDGEDHRGDRARTRPPACRTSSTCATRPPAACSPRGARSATSPPPNRGR